MSRAKLNRRRFLKTSTALSGAILTGVAGRATGFQSANDRPRIGVVGCGSRWDQRATIANGPHGLGKEFPKFGDIVAVCDVDGNRVDRAKNLVKEWLGRPPEGTGDYRKIIDRDDVDVVHIVTPDHWHAKVAIEAMLAGKDVYCEKPMTLTIEEGRQICDVCRRTGQVVQVGTQQRSSSRFITAIAMIRAARARALLDGRTFVIPDDVKTMALPALRHRLQLAPEAEIEGQTTDSVLVAVLSEVEAPRE